MNRDTKTAGGSPAAEPYLYKIIQRYCEDASSSNGLFLIDMPTGFGKTHSVLDYIYTAACSDKFTGKKIFFITSLKKNLPQKELEERFAKAGKAELFKEKFLFLDSYSDCVISNLSSDVKNDIPNEIRYSEEYKALIQDVDFLQKKKVQTDKELRGFVSSIRNNLNKNSEPEFRKYIQALLAKQYRNVNDRIYAVKTDPQWKWLGKLYPCVFTKERQIIFMSVDKFLKQNSTIVEPPSMLYNSPYVKDAIIFIDEFDAAKETLLGNIIEEGLRDRIDYLNLFREIYAALLTNKFPRKLTAPSKQRTEGPHKNRSLQSVIDGIRERAEEIHDEYSLQFPHKTADEVIDGSRNFLFQDHQFHSILDADKSYIVTARDEAQQVNTIKFTAKKPAAEHNNIHFMLGKLRGFIKFFQGAVYILAVNYRQCKMEQRRDGEDAFSIESAISSVLTEFSLSDSHKKYITSQILASSYRTRGTIGGSEFDLSFYEKGFRYYNFVDDPAHDMRSQIMMYGFQNTPEKLLLRFCEKAKVIGISATATVPSVIGNFDLDYIKSRMQSSYTELSEEDRRIIQGEFAKATAGYRNININTELISGKDRSGVYSPEAWKKAFDSDEAAEWAYNCIEQELPYENDYKKERYLRIVLAYKNFWSHPDIQSFLCVLTKHPRENDKELDLNVLYRLFSLIHKSLGITKKPQDTVVRLDGDEFDSKKDIVKKKLENGEKLFVISVYQTIGSGQNLQYRVPEGSAGDMLLTNAYKSRGEKDFDAIYLDRPTHVIVQLGDNLEDKDFVKYLFQVEFLQDAGELSPKDSFAHIKKAFVTFYTGHDQKNMRSDNIYRCRGTVLLATRTVIQAIGRICRTNQKKKNIYIFADSRITDSIDLSVSKGRLMNPEFLALLDRLKECPPVNIAGRNPEYGASLLSMKVNKYINNFLSEKWTEERIALWQELRRLVLRRPTMTKQEIEGNFFAKNFYLEMPEKSAKFWYQQQDDYNNIRVGFTKSSELPFEVSAAAARLEQLMLIPGLRQMFENEGYAASFAENEYILSPALFNNIYKGALGEAAGRFIFEKLGVELEEINDPEIFELFDYKVPGKAVFVDFKHWEESTEFLAEGMLEKISRKARECHAELVLVVNILAGRGYKIHDTVVDGINIVEIPSLLYSDGDGTFRFVNEALWKIKERAANEIFS